MATDTTTLAEAIAAMRDAVAASELAHGDGWYATAKARSKLDAGVAAVAAGGREESAGRALLAALEGVPARIALLEDLAEVACWLADSCGTTQERRDDSYATVDTYSPQAKTMLDAALDALDALDGGGPG